MRILVLVLALAGNAGVAAQECRPASWLRLSGERPAAIATQELIADMAQRDAVLLGELHTEADHHRWQLHTLAALHAQRPRMVIGFEMFPRRAQPVLDRWVAGELSAEQLLEQTRWNEVWSTPAELYLPLFEFARLHRIPMVALNVERKLTQQVAQAGWDAVPDAEREGLTRPVPAPQAYRDLLFEVYREHRSARGTPPARPDAGFAHFVDAQQTWDRAMAQALFSRLDVPAESRPLAVGIIGMGHLQNGHGVALQLRALGVARVGSLLPLAARSECKEARPGLADAVYLLPEAPGKPPPPRVGVRLEQQGALVKIADVGAGSLAERSGLKGGDTVVSVAGMPVSKVEDLVGAVRRQPGGTWLPLQVKRGEALLEIVLKFPAAR